MFCLFFCMSHGCSEHSEHLCHHTLSLLALYGFLLKLLELSLSLEWRSYTFFRGSQQAILYTCAVLAGSVLLAVQLSIYSRHSNWYWKLSYSNLNKPVLQAGQSEGYPPAPYSHLCFKWRSCHLLAKTMWTLALTAENMVRLTGYIIYVNDC